MNKGAYLLFIQLNSRTDVEVGSLGEFVFEPGLYCYVGSGMNGLDQRVGRHKSEDKNKYWHIDYLLEEGDIVSTLKFRTEQDLECRLSKLISSFSEKTPVSGFGSSDCGCCSHLYYLG